MAIATPLLFRKKVLALLQETTIGTAASITNVNAGFKSYDQVLTYNRAGIERDRQGGIGSDVPIASGASAELTFRSYVHGKGASGAIPMWANFIEACGMTASSTTYSTTQTQSAWKTLTAKLCIDGRVKAARGLMGSFRLGIAAGQPCTMDWTFTGGATDAADSAILTGMTYETAVPPLWTACTIGGSSDFPVSKIDFDLGNEVALREDPNSAGGYLCGWIGNRKPTLTLDPEAALYAVKNWPALQLAGTTTTIVATFNGGTNNTVTITFSGCALNQYPNEGDRDGKVVDNVNTILTADSFSIAFS